jgi:hypothetical protein
MLGALHCPKCGDQLSSAIRSLSTPNVYLQTCRNYACLHTVRTVVEVAPEPEWPRPVSLPLPVEGPRPPAGPSAIAAFERAYERGEQQKAIARTRRQARAVSAGDVKAKQLGRNA